MTPDKQLSILVFTRDLDRYSLMMLRELQQMGQTVHVVTEPQTSANAKDWSKEIHVVAQVKLEGRFDKAAAQRYSDLVAHYRADICLCYTSRALSVALTAKRHFKFEAPIVGTRGAIGGVSAFYLQDWFTYLSPRLNAVVCMSQAIADKLNQEARRFYPKHPGHFEVIYPGYGQLLQTHDWPASRARQASEVVRLLCIANDRPIKGLAVLLQAVAHHLPAENWQLDIVGECGPAVRTQVSQSARLSQHVHVHGYRNDVPHFLKQAHIYIQPTLKPGEGIGNSMAEAMSHGLPVITSNVGGGIELVNHEQTGLHFAAEDPAALGAAIHRLMAQPALCDQLGQQGARRLQERFSLRQEAESFLTLFKSLRQPLRHPTQR